MLFVEAFAEAALLRDPNRAAIAANVELEVRIDPDGQAVIHCRFLFAGRGGTVPWDGTDEGAEAIVKSTAIGLAESLALDPHEDDDWRDAFERRS
jgi:hypothetical protein